MIKRKKIYLQLKLLINFIKNRLKGSRYLLVVFILASLDFFLLGVQVISKGVSAEVSLVVVAYFLVVLIIQLIILSFVFLITKNAAARYLATGFVLSANLIEFYVSFFEKYLSINKQQIILTGLLTGLGFAAMLFLTTRYRKFFWVAIVILGVNSLVTVTSTLAYSQPNAAIDKSNQNLAKYKDIKFKEKPNIHLVSFDSMQAEAIVKKHMDISKLAYENYLNDNSYVFKNTFVSNAPSQYSLNSIMRLADPDFSGYDFFAGRSESPISYIFRNNGYKISNGFYDDEFFGAQGKYVQEFRTLDSSEYLSDSTLCKFSERKEKVLQLYNFCSFVPKLVEEKKDSPQYYQEAFNVIDSKSKNSEPWLTFHYIYDPFGHTAKAFNSSDVAEKAAYVQRYKRQGQKLADILPDLINKIKEDDPNSIVLIFGDHGPWLSRTMNFDDNPEYFVQDRYAVHLSILKTNNKCSSFEVVDHYNIDFSTPERVLAGVIRCLSDNTSAVDKAVNFKESYPYKEYLYE